MSGKRQPPDFQHNPFKALKGLSVSSQRQPKDPPDKRPKPPPAEPAGDQSFAEEMAHLGVRPLAGAGGEPDAGADPDPGGPPVATGEGFSDREEFLAAVGQVDPLQGEPGGEPPVQARPRRMKQLRQGRLVPEATLDLHGTTRSEAVQKLGHFLENARFHGFTTLLVITGKGHHSAEGPILRQAVATYLEGPGRNQVREWGPAPRNYGGDGALILFLRTS